MKSSFLQTLFGESRKNQSNDARYQTSPQERGKLVFPTKKVEGRPKVSRSSSHILQRSMLHEALMEEISAQGKSETTGSTAATAEKPSRQITPPSIDLLPRANRSKGKRTSTSPTHKTASKRSPASPTRSTSPTGNCVSRYAYSNGPSNIVSLGALAAGVGAAKSASRAQQQRQPQQLLQQPSGSPNYKRKPIVLLRSMSHQSRSKDESNRPNSSSVNHTPPSTSHQQRIRRKTSESPPMPLMFLTKSTSTGKPNSVAVSSFTSLGASPH